MTFPLTDRLSVPIVVWVLSPSSTWTYHICPVSISIFQPLSRGVACQFLTLSSSVQPRNCGGCKKDNESAVFYCYCEMLHTKACQRTIWRIILWSSFCNINFKHSNDGYLRDTEWLLFLSRSLSFLQLPSHLGRTCFIGSKFKNKTHTKHQTKSNLRSRCYFDKFNTAQIHSIWEMLLILLASNLRGIYAE